MPGDAPPLIIGHYREQHIGQKLLVVLGAQVRLSEVDHSSVVHDRATLADLRAVEPVIVSADIPELDDRAEREAGVLRVEVRVVPAEPTGRLGDPLANETPLGRLHQMEEVLDAAKGERVRENPEGHVPVPLLVVAHRFAPRTGHAGIKGTLQLQEVVDVVLQPELFKL